MRLSASWCVADDDHARVLSNPFQRRRHGASTPRWRRRQRHHRVSAASRTGVGAVAHPIRFAVVRATLPLSRCRGRSRSAPELSVAHHLVDATQLGSSPGQPSRLRGRHRKLMRLAAMAASCAVLSSGSALDLGVGLWHVLRAPLSATRGTGPRRGEHRATYACTNRGSDAFLQPSSNAIWRMFVAVSRSVMPMSRTSISSTCVRSILWPCRHVLGVGSLGQPLAGPADRHVAGTGSCALWSCRDRVDAHRTHHSGRIRQRAHTRWLASRLRCTCRCARARLLVVGLPRRRSAAQAHVDALLLAL